MAGDYRIKGHDPNTEDGLAAPWKPKPLNRKLIDSAMQKAKPLPVRGRRKLPANGVLDPSKFQQF